MTEDGYKRAQSDNLPCVDAIMVASFLKNNDCFVAAEIRGSKANSAGRENYGDSAIGYVQLKRQSGKCIVKCKICPEHKVKSKNYTVTLIVDEEQYCIDSVECHDCAASSGGCKHAIAFLMWVHRRSEEKATTSVKCYWKKSELSTVGTSKKFITAKDLGKKKLSTGVTTDSSSSNGSFLNAVVVAGKELKIENQLCRYFTESDCIKKLSLHYLAIKFAERGGDSESFLTFAKENMHAESIKLAERQTLKQHDDPAWHELRYMRITASKLHEATRCRTPEGTFVERVIGAVKTTQTKTMKRGCTLETEVIATLQALLGSKIQKSGLLLSASHPVMGASPDGIGKDFVVEVKCPARESSVGNYVNNGKISDKFLLQIQMQMHFSKMEKGVFCVADPSFEATKCISIFWVDYDEELAIRAINEGEKFWKECIFPVLMRSVKPISV